MPRKTLTEQDKKYILDNYHEKNYEKLSQEIGCCKVSVWRILHNNGLVGYNNKRKIYTKEDVLFLKNNYYKLSIKDLCDKFKCTYQTIRHKLKELGIEHKPSVYDKDIYKLAKYGYKLLSRIGNKVKVNCKQCNKEFITTTNKLISGHTKSCGCIRGRSRWTGTKYISGEFFGIIKRGAEYRNLQFSITIEDIENLLIQQHFKCALTGWDLKYGRIHRSKITMSVDRIDSNKGYTKNNIIIVHKDINMSKQSYSLEYYIKLCNAVAKYNNGY